MVDEYNHAKLIKTAAEIEWIKEPSSEETKDAEENKDDFTRIC